jgi:hypothetical protein
MLDWVIEGVENGVLREFFEERPGNRLVSKYWTRLVEARWVMLYHMIRISHIQVKLIGVRPGRPLRDCGEKGHFKPFLILFNKLIVLKLL